MLGSSLAGVTVAIEQWLVHHITDLKVCNQKSVVALNIRVRFPIVTPWVGNPSGEGGGL